MTDQSNTTPGNGIKTKMPRRKKIIITLLAVHLAFAVVDSCVLHGPCADWFMSRIGPGRLVIGGLGYRIEPEQNEIVLNWGEQVRQRDFHFDEPGVGYSEHIALDPLPPDLTRCYVEVTVDPEAPPVVEKRFDTIMRGATPYFESENIIGTDPATLTAEQAVDLPPDMVFRLRVRPEDVPVLSREFILKANPGTPIEKMLFPCPGEPLEGRCTMVMSKTETGPYYLATLKQKIVDHTYNPVSILRMIPVVVLMPIAVIPDYLAELFLIIFYALFFSQDF
ncbi:MAG: hypothetical protein PUC15_06865 [Lentisphaeria bacterium]|nr:hypothetical protein [Lentisphaeria bacterium]